MPEEHRVLGTGEPLVNLKARPGVSKERPGQETELGIGDTATPMPGEDQPLLEGERPLTGKEEQRLLSGDQKGY